MIAAALHPRPRISWSTAIGLFWLVSSATWFSTVLAAPPWVENLLHPFSRQGEKPETSEDHAVETLAANIDWLEHQIDYWGTVVAKSPDVWGEARLTKYRREIEKQLGEQVKGFDPDRISGASFVRDQALLAAAVGVGSGVDTAPSARSILGSSDATSLTMKFEDNTALGGFGLSDSDEVLFGNALKLEQTAVLDQHKRYLNHLAELRRINEGDDSSDAPGYAINLVRMPVSVIPGTRTRHGYGAEITVSASMQFDDHLLPELFRDLVVNDLVRQLALPLTRFLNSDPRRVNRLLEDFETQESVLAELNERVGEKLVLTSNPSVLQRIKSLATPGKIDVSQLEFLTLEDSLLALTGPIRIHEMDRFNSEVNILIELLTTVAQANAAQIETFKVALAKEFKDTEGEQREPSPGEPVNSDTIEELNLDGYSDVLGKLSQLKSRSPKLFRQLSANVGVVEDAQFSGQLEKASRLNTAMQTDTEISQAQTAVNDIESILNILRPISDALASFARNLDASVSGSSLPTSLTHRSRLPVPPTQLLELYGFDSLGHLVLEAHKAFRSDLVNREIVHLTDVQAFLREEIHAAYELLSRPAFRHLWEPFLADSMHETVMTELIAHEPFPSVTRSIVDLVRERRTVELAQQRELVLSQLAGDLGHRASGTLVWGIYVLSRLLNERLIEDMQGYGIAEVCVSETYLSFYGPDPSPEARAAFRAYVAARWPLRIFTIDPVVTEQNIADSASIYRQMQFAAAIAVASGQMNANAAMQFVRQLQRDMATIDVNRTVVGFVHGEDTFGWRFYPRFQTAPVQNNAVTVFRDLVVGGPTDRQLLRQREIEPGMRECVAVILAPSFIHNVTLDTRANWFKLTKPSHTALSMQETAELSRSISQMKLAAESCIRRPDLYRNGEVDRMLRRVEQLDRELPLQTLRCQIAESNTLGGFEFFSSGTRELAPELLGWYGSPGYRKDVDKQTFFLVGDNFSVHETKVIAGTKEVSEVTLLSRQIMQVTVPKDLPVIEDERLGITYDNRNGDRHSVNNFEGFIDIHVATPYGVSGHLLVPVLKKPCPEPAKAVAQVPTLVEAMVDVEVPVSHVNGVYAAAHPIVTPQAPLATIAVPPGTGLIRTGSSAKITLYPQHGDNRLPPIIVEDVLPTGNQYLIGLPQVVQGVTESGAFTQSLGGYLAWLLNATKAANGEVSAISGNPTEVDITATLSLDGGPPIQIAGKSKLRLQTLVR